MPGSSDDGEAPSRRLKARSANITLDQLPLYATDAELGPAIMGKRASEWPRIAKLYEGHGLPKFNTLLGGRYTPAVRKFFDILEGSHSPGVLPARDGQERLDLWNMPRRRRRASNGASD